jgi:P-type E1-E2 ATPase
MSVRPSDAPVPCARCGAPVEPLRAPCVVLLDAEPEPRVLCSLACRDSLVAGLAAVPTVRVGQARSERPRSDRPRSATSSWTSSSDPGLVKTRKRRDATWTGDHAPSAPPPLAPPPTLALGLACAALVSAAFATGITVAAISAVFVIASAAAALAGGAHLRESAGWVAYVAGPTAAVVSAASAIVIQLDGSDARLPLVGAAFVAALANLRWWIDSLTEAPVHALEQRVRRSVPGSVRVAGPEGAPESVPVERVRVGEEIVVEEGDVVGVDGVVQKGSAVVLLHPTSRSPVRREPGAPVLAGARVVEGRLRVLATRVGPDRALLRPLRFADASAADAAPLTRLASRLVALTSIVAAVGVIAGVVLAAPEGGLAARLAAGAAVLVALPVLSLRRASSTPFAAAALAAAERGVTFASAHALDRAGRVTSAVLCSHGTVTEGTPEVVEAYSIGDAPSTLAAVIGLAAAVEQDAAHPTARALVAHARATGAPLPTVRRVTVVPGRGVRASGPDGEVVLVGSRQLLLDEATSVAAVEPEVQAAEARGLSVVFVAVDGKARAWIALRDEVRNGARAAVQRLIDLDIDALIVSGDHRGSVEALAKSVDVDHVKAELGPEERVAEVRRLREVGGRVAVVGRVISDAEVLAAADLPVLLGAAGSPESERGVALASDDLRDASAALWMARAASRDALRASVSAVAAGAVLVAIGALGLAAPGIVAILALFVDLYALPTPARVLQRIELRLPGRG